MNADRLLAHYEKIADAPDAIAQLRRFILDLAVRGKLVPQDASDEPASELLKRIAKEKARLQVGGRRREAANRSEAISQGELPAGWIEVRGSEIFPTRSGNSKLIKGKLHSEPAKGPYPGYSAAGQDVWLDDWEHEGVAIILSAVGARCGKAFLATGRWSAVANTHIVWVLSEITRPEFAMLHLNNEAFWVRSGGAQPFVKVAETLSRTFPLPPLAEQHRIVAKVDELMALCDRLEAARGRREAVRDRLAAASLVRLNAPDPETFQSDARFALDALPALTTRPDQIKPLRQTILNLAVRGKLVPQDPNDEPASALLKRITAENKKLMATKGIRSQKPALPAENFESDSEIPLTWRHIYLQDISYQITDGTHLTPKYTETGKPFLSAQNVKPFRFMPDKHRFVSEADFDNYRANRRPERGDILMTRVGAGIGEATVLDSDFEFAFYVSLCLIKVPNRFVSVDYLVLWLNSPEGRESSTIRTYGKGASQGNLNLGLIRTFKIPLPPLAEQHRIVAKVDLLMALCHRLDASLAATRHPPPPPRRSPRRSARAEGGARA